MLVPCFPRAFLAAPLVVVLVTTAVAAGSGLTLDFAGAPERFAPVPGGAGATRFSMLDAIGIKGAAGTARLVIEVVLPPGATAGSDPVDARVTYRPGGFRDYWQTAEVPPPGAIVLEKVALHGPKPHVAGRFRVTLCRRGSGILPADAGDCRMAAGTFDTALTRD